MVSRKKALSTVEKAETLLRTLADGRAKLHVIRRGLELRKRLPCLFHGARYTPLYADAGMEEKICAFSLSDRKDTVIAVAPRLFASMMKAEDQFPIGEKIWRESRLVLPEGDYKDLMTGREFQRRTAARGGAARGISRWRFSSAAREGA